MNLPLLFVVSCLAFTVCHADDRLSYADAVALAKERGAKWTSGGNEKPQPVYVVLFPNSTTEITEAQGKEVRKRIPFCAIANAPATVGEIAKSCNLASNLAYQIEILRAGSDKPVVRIEGETAELHLSQYRLQAEDVVVVGRKPGETK